MAELTPRTVASVDQVHASGVEWINRRVEGLIQLYEPGKESTLGASLAGELLDHGDGPEGLAVLLAIAMTRLAGVEWERLVRRG